MGSLIRLFSCFCGWIFLAGGCLGDVPAIVGSESADGVYHAVMDVDRDPKIQVEWKGDSYPKIEITEKVTGKVVAAISYFGGYW